MAFRSIKLNLVDKFFIYAMVDKLLPVEYDTNFLGLARITLQPLRYEKSDDNNELYWSNNPIVKISVTTTETWEKHSLLVSSCDILSTKF